MRLGVGFVEVRADRKLFDGDLKSLASDIKGGRSGAGDVSNALRDALVGGAFLTGAKRAAETASRLQQAVGGTAAVFGKAATEVERFAEGAAESAGLSERAARELTSSLGGLLKGFDFTADEAASLSVTLSKLGADLAATFGGTPEEAVQALGAALRGETDPLERFGIALNQTAVNQRAVELGLAASTSAVDANAKAQATLSLITERSADAQGQFAREAGTAAGQAAIAAAKAENSAADLGENLLPIYTKIAEVVGTAADAFGALPEPVQTSVIALAGIAALTGPATVAISAIGSLATIARTQLASGFETAGIRALYLKDNLGKMALGVGAAGAAVGIAALIWDQYSSSKADAVARTEELIDAIAREKDGLEGEVTSVNLAKVLAGELGEAAREAGANLEVIGDAISGQAEDVDALGESLTGLGGIDELGDLETALRNAGLEGSAFADELLRLQESGALSDSQLNDLIIRMGEQADATIRARRETENKAAADETAGKAAGNAAGPVGELTGELDLNEQAAKEAAESVDLFREAVEKALAPLDLEETLDARVEALNDLASAIDDRARAVEDAQRRVAELQAIPVADRSDDFAQQLADARAAVEEAIAATSLSLTGNEEAAVRNRDVVRDLVDDVAAIISANREQGASLGELQAIRDAEVENLRTQLTQLGFNEAEIGEYIAAIERIPITKATTVTVESAAAQLRIKELADSLKALGPNASFGIDGAVIDRNLQRAAAQARGFAAGGLVPDGLFEVGEHGRELLRKSGANLEVLAGAPAAVAGGTPMVVNITIVAPDVENGLTAASRRMRHLATEVP